MQQVLKGVDDLPIEQKHKHTAINMFLLRVLLHAVRIVVTANPVTQQTTQQSVGQFTAQ